jgi:hypothetical protein
MLSNQTWRLLVAFSVSLLAFGKAPLSQAQSKSDSVGEIKAYCLDFNWTPTSRRGKPFAKPGLWNESDPAEHVAWYKTMGANVIQTFCVSTNGYAWYKNGVVPEQPGLKHDFLPEVVKLGHKEGMKVMGYFCIAANPRWAELHPDQSYGSPTTYHIPYTDDYLAFLSESISDAVRKTGIDGFMIDWVWMPNRKSTEGKWLQCEKDLYKQLMGEAFPGEDKLTKAQDTEYSRKAIDRCWKAIRKAAKDANPKCIVWLTVNQISNPHVINSPMYQEADWLMNEAGSVEAIEKVRGMVGDHTQLITCLAVWNGQDASKAVPEAIEAGVGLYGFTAPRKGNGLVPLEEIFTRQVSELSGDSRNIAVLARAYNGKSIHSLWKDGHFIEPEMTPYFEIRLKGRGRGSADTALVDHGKDSAAATITTPYGKGRGQLIRNGDKWPSSLTIRLQKNKDLAPETTKFLIANGSSGLAVSLDGSDKVSFGKMEGGLDLGKEWGDKFPVLDDTGPKVPVTRTDALLEIKIPSEITEGNPESLAFEWGSGF